MVKNGGPERSVGGCVPVRPAAVHTAAGVVSPIPAAAVSVSGVFSASPSGTAAAAS